MVARSRLPTSGDIDDFVIYGGEYVRLVREILPASDIVRALIEDAAQIVAHSRALQRPLDKGLRGRRRCVSEGTFKASWHTNYDVVASATSFRKIVRTNRWSSQQPFVGWDRWFDNHQHVAGKRTLQVIDLVPRSPEPQIDLFRGRQDCRHRLEMKSERRSPCVRNRTAHIHARNRGRAERLDDRIGEQDANNDNRDESDHETEIGKHLKLLAKCRLLLVSQR